MSSKRKNDNEVEDSQSKQQKVEQILVFGIWCVSTYDVQKNAFIFLGNEGNYENIMTLLQAYDESNYVFYTHSFMIDPPLSKLATVHWLLEHTEEGLSRIFRVEESKDEEPNEDDDTFEGDEKKQLINLYDYIMKNPLEFKSFIIEDLPDDLDSERESGAEEEKEIQEEDIDKIHSKLKEQIPDPNENVTGFKLWLEEAQLYVYSEDVPTNELSMNFVATIAGTHKEDDPKQALKDVLTEFKLECYIK